ncbi:uncharacterized protein LOC6559216 isoform X2 [Drosophila grimshawi]|uniref:uncharacterized protein LOC6559216 isoform X2 n=1 Tax=Drosophila grimshawi TaxID=7222 RepID=UPI000C8704B1|nr:uncharacterized protein LOC6559216 isoform X2 [Drosophila grimshawi]
MAQSNRNDAKKKGVKRPSAYPTTSDVNTKINCQMQPAQSSKHVVEEIMQRRVFLGRNQVLVRWTGSTKSEWTWEFPESLGKDVDKKIAQFDAKYAASKNDALSQIAEVDLSSPSSNSSDDDDQQQQQQHVKSVKDTKGTSQYASDASREQVSSRPAT